MTFLTEPFDRLFNFFKGARNGYSPQVRQFFKDNSKNYITHIVVCRTPIQSYINMFLNFITIGAFNKALQHLNYDTLFHLYALIYISSGKVFRVEKNEVIKIVEDSKKGEECKTVRLKKFINVLEFFDNARKQQPENYFFYNAKTNNCQTFLTSLLNGNNLLTPELKKFIQQDAISLFEQMPWYTDKIANIITDLGARTDILLSGAKLYNMKKKGGDIFSKKSEESFSKDMKEAIKILQISKDGLIPFGSQFYSSSLYPSDIDLIDTLYVKGTKSKLKPIVEKLQNVVKKILSTKNCYLGDIKSGIDYVYKLDIGNINYSYGGHPVITHYDYEKVKEQLDNLHKAELLTNDEFKKINSYVKKDISPKNFEDLQDSLRKKWLLRWTSKEFLQGYKDLSGGRKITLFETIQMPSLTKIDSYQLVDDKYTEVTCIYLIVYTDTKGNQLVMSYPVYKFSQRTYPFPTEEILYTLRKDTSILLFSNNHYKPQKAMKRIYALSRMMRDEKVANIIVPLLQSDMGRMYQISSYLDNIVKILEIAKKPPMKNIYSQLSDLKYSLANIYDEKLKDSLYKEFDKLQDLKGDKLIKAIESIREYLDNLNIDISEKFYNIHKGDITPENYLN
jgi:hypothetical protein